jgi:IclR family pca regulon transcriptional regulator
MQKVKDNFVTALSRGISILEAFDEANPELGITQISRKVGLSKTTTFRLVQTLVVLRYLVLSSENKYRLGPRVLSLGFSVLQTLDLKTIAAPYLQSLARQCHETVNMAVLDEDELVYIERIRTQQIVNINLHVGSRLPLYNTAMGRALLAYQPEPWLQEYIDRMTADPDASPHLGKKGIKLLMQLESVRMKKYAINDEDLVKGLRSIAAPVRDGKGEVVAVVNIAVPSARVTVGGLETTFAPQLLTAVQTISEVLGFRGNDRVFRPEV